ncbi:MAG: DUF1592 domain-containing protein [Phycisphaerales bacterium]|nr:DUF1592 domain-containing protein [Phycisphaerales bacterium]
MGTAWLAGAGWAAALGAMTLGQPESSPPGPDPLAARLEQRLATDIVPLMEQYCYRCHGAAKSKGDIRFEGVASMPDIMAMADDWETARDRLTTHEMPPEEEETQPTEHERLTIIQWIDDALAYYPPDAPVDPGWFTIHRLNKPEYRNTLRDLLGIDPSRVDLAAELPADDTGYGFDNIADVLSMSPMQMELYLDAAERAVELGLGPIVGVHPEPVPLRPLVAPRNGQPLAGGGHMLYANGDVVARVDAPAAADYEIVVTAWGTPGGEEEPRLSVRVDGREVQAFAVEARRDAPAEYRVPVRLAMGNHKIVGAFTNDFYIENVADRNLAIEDISLAGPLTSTGIERPEAYSRVFFVPEGRGEEGSRLAARRIIGRFAAGAFRRPVKDEEFRRLMLLYESARKAGDSYEEAVRLVLSGVLVSPSFLYRSLDNRHGDEPGTVYDLNDYELASRLSYFLWSSMPDEELEDLAGKGRLRDPAVLREQARRMLADPKADAFITNFAGQWLLLRNLDRLDIDRTKFPEYSSELRADMITEATMFFGDIVRGDRSILELIDGHETFVNDRLARLYGLDGVKGSEFRRVALDPGSHRGGVLTMGAVLTVTSNPGRTSPVKRGLYVLDELLGSPPPPPPADIPRLEQSAAAVGEDATLREKLAVHLTNPNCAVCHRRMDPIGLAMENYDAIGRWRDTQDGRAIDVSGELPGGVAFNGPEELKRILLAREGDFVENLSRKVLTYALGRGLEPFDRPTVREVTGEVRARGDRFGALVEAVVASEAFRSCRGREVGP